MSRFHLFARSLAACWGRALLMGAACAVLAVTACWFALPGPRPTVTASLRFTSTPEDDPLLLRQELISLIRDPNTLATALRQAEAAGQKRGMADSEMQERLGSVLQIDAAPGTGRVTISLAEMAAVDSPTLINALVETVLREAGARERRERETRLTQAETRLRAAQDEARQARARLPGLTEEVETAVTRHKAAVERLGELERELRQTRTQRTTIETELILARSRSAATAPVTPPPGEASPQPVEDELIRQWYADRIRLVGEIEQMRARSLPGKTPPALERALADLASLDRQIKERRGQLAAVSPAPKPAVPIVSVDSSSLQTLENQRASALAQEKRLEEEHRRQGEVCRNLTAAVKEAERIREAVTPAEAAVSRARAEVELRQRSLEAPPRLTAEQWAHSLAPLALRQWSTALAAAAGMLIVLLGYGCHEYRMGRIHSAEDFTSMSDLELFGVLPQARSAVERRLAGHTPKPGDKGARQLSEAFDAVRTRLLYEAETHGLRLLLVTSASAGEGKTSLASQLAISLARAWRRTLLVDADLRKPAAHRLFGLPLEPGFGDILRGESEIDSVIHATPISRLWTIPAGLGNDHALQALAQDVGSALAELKARFDFIVIDCPPVLPVADALMLGRHVDGVLLSVLLGTSRQPLLQEARQRLQALGIPILGAVVAGVPRDSYGAGDVIPAVVAKQPAA